MSFFFLIHYTENIDISTKGLQHKKEEQKITGPTGPNGCLKSENNCETELLL